MPLISNSFDPNVVEWRHAIDLTDPSFLIDYEYCLLGYDLPTGRLDMMLRFTANERHCQRHRHIASTVTIVLEGEHHIDEIQPDGSIKSIIRRKGEYAFSEPDGLPHEERGGTDGGTVLLAVSAKDGKLFEYFDSNMKSVRTLTIEEYVEAWRIKSVPGRGKLFS